jgi:prepilin-type processing-associated H-X9-DG protein
MASESPRNNTPPLTFSLRTMFRIVTCAAVTAAFLTCASRNFEPPALLPAVGIFFITWFAIKRQAGAAVIWFFVTIIFFMIAPISPNVHELRRRGECANHLRNIGDALFAYEQEQHSLPPAFVVDSRGKTLLSWRVSLLPYLDYLPVYEGFRRDEAWNAPRNRVFSQIPISWYLCPDGTAVCPTTNYLAVVGPQTAWPGATGRKLSEIKDPSKTILVIEVANSNINWAEPRDLTIDQIAQGINAPGGLGISSHHPGGVHALFADGHVEFLSENIDPKQLVRMFDIDPSDNPSP